MFAVIGNVLACVCWGAFISLIVVLLLYVVIKVIYPTYSFSIVSVLSLVVLTVFLFIQSFLMVGAGYIKDYTGKIGDLTLSVIDQMEKTTRYAIADVNRSYDSASGQVDVAVIREALVKEYPFIEKYVESLDDLKGIVTDASPTMVASAVVDGVNEEINAYMWRRGFWMLGALVLVMVVVVLTKPRFSYSSMPDEDYYSMDY